MTRLSLSAPRHINAVQLPLSRQETLGIWMCPRTGALSRLARVSVPPEPARMPCHMILQEAPRSLEPWLSSLASRIAEFDQPSMQH